MDQNNKVIEFLEKPENPPSTLAASACYLFPREVMKQVPLFLEQEGRKDAPGFFIKWISEKQPTHAFTFSGHWFDIGDLESLERAREFMKNQS